MYKTYTRSELDWTIQNYPEMGNAGWAFWQNWEKKDCLNNEEFKKSLLEDNHRYGITDVLFAEEVKAYDHRKDILSDYYPVFIKTGCVKTLKALNFIFPHQRPRVNIFDLLDLEDE